MTTVNVNIKWGKNSYDVEVDREAGIENFQAILFSLTNVPPTRQKILMKGKVLRTDEDITNITNDAKLMMMGSADELPQAPKTKITFEEDMTESQKVAAGAVNHTAGLNNLGNTCYLNSTLQVLHAVPELKSAVVDFASSQGSRAINTADGTVTLTSQFGNLMKEMDSTSQPVTPFLFLSIFRSLFPQFAEKHPESGQWMQQDAEEAFSQLLNVLQSKLDTTQHPHTVEKLFGGELESKIHCVESKEEPDQKITEKFLRLRCQIDMKTNFLSEGIENDMQSEFERRSPTLNRNALYKKRSAISQLPQYVVVQFARFFWRNDTQKKAKILRKVTFPTKWDITEHCTSSLRRSMLAVRRVLKEEEDKKLGLSSVLRAKNIAAIKDQAERNAEKEKERAGDAKLEIEDLSAPFQKVNNSGFLDLIALVTHKGRSADSGHYVGWVKSSLNATDAKVTKWLKYDDSTVTEVTEDEVRVLYGGGDHHMAYLAIYKRIDDYEGREMPQPDFAMSDVSDSSTSSTTGSSKSS